jgi:hypothetical protein
MAEIRDRQREMDPKNFFAELKRRNVYKVAVAYANRKPLNSETRSLNPT